jgi:hypothetical protein
MTEDAFDISRTHIERNFVVVVEFEVYPLPKFFVHVRSDLIDFNLLVTSTQNVIDVGVIEDENFQEWLDRRVSPPLHRLCVVLEN